MAPHPPPSPDIPRPAAATPPPAGNSRDREAPEGRRSDQTDIFQTLAEVTAEIARELDLPAVLSLIHRRAIALLRADGGSLYLHDPEGEQLVPRIWHGIPDSLGAQPLRLGEGLGGTVAMRRTGMVVNDYRRYPNAHPAVLAATGIAAIMAQPLLVHGRLIGVVTLNRREGSPPFTRADLQMLGLLASQAAIAIVNARLHETATVQRRRMAILNEVTRTLAAELDPERVFRRILEAVRVLVPDALARLHELPEGAEDLRLVASIGFTGFDGREGKPLRKGEGLAAIAIATRRPVTSDDVRSDPRFANREWATTVGLVAATILPLVYADRVCGILGVGLRRPHSFTGEEVDLLRALAAAGAVALQNARLFERVREGQQELARLSQRLVATQEEERRRVSRELHDEAGQALTVLRIEMDLLRRELPADAPGLRAHLDRAVELTAQTAERLERLTHNLHPPSLEAVGLCAALEELCREVGQQGGLQIAFRGVEVREVPAPMAIHLYRCLQESLTNVLRHARASRVRVTLDVHQRRLRLAVQDDGVGFEQPIAGPPLRGLGLTGMRERMDILRGSLEVVSVPGQGTRLVATVPWGEP